MWCSHVHITLGYPSQRTPRPPPSGISAPVCLAGIGGNLTAGLADFLDRHTPAVAAAARRTVEEVLAPARVQGSGFRVQGSGFRVQGSWFRVQGSWFRVQGSGFRVEDFVFRVPCLGFRI